MEDYKYKLSIIIPMYNREKYIADCLDSILESDLPKEDYEVIIINDGSEDSGPEIAQEYCFKYNHFVYLTQENQGQGVARNYGIEKARGEYVWFVDSDDKVEKSVAIVLSWLNKGIDIINTRMRVLEEKGNLLYITDPPVLPYNIIMQGENVFYSKQVIASVCVQFIRKAFLVKNKLRFLSGITHEDVELSNRLFVYAQSIVFIDKITYIYIKHSGSTSSPVTKEKKIKYLLDELVVINSLTNLSKSVSLTNQKLSKIIMYKRNDTLLSVFINIYRNRNEYVKDSIFLTVINAFRMERMFPLRCRFDSIKKQILAQFLNIILKYYIYEYRKNNNL